MHVVILPSVMLGSAFKTVQFSAIELHKHGLLAIAMIVEGPQVF